MPGPLATLTAGLALAILSACLYLRTLRNRITGRTTLGLLALAATLVVASAVALHNWPWAAASIPAALLLAFVWLTAPRPASDTDQIQESQP
ncbi:hypothetical protein [Streptomyces sp. NPDC059489]|uniref:hypothetical protein n=1 Tax=Streptomyces sp. NPDC059489 TaxID=3346849 RepID=UPI00369357DE